MTNALIFSVSCEVHGLEESFQGSFLVMFFQGMLNMAHQMRKCAKISNMFLLNLHKQIYKSALPKLLWKGQARMVKGLC
jgi:hypothetical protein